VDITFIEAEIHCPREDRFMERKERERQLLVQGETCSRMPVKPILDWPVLPSTGNEHERR